MKNICLYIAIHKIENYPEINDGLINKFIYKKLKIIIIIIIIIII